MNVDSNGVSPSLLGIQEEVEVNVENEEDIEAAGPGEVIEEHTVGPPEVKDVSKLEDGVVVDVKDENAMKPNGAVNPKLPSKNEIEEHELLGHSVYRNWCDVCVKAWG